MDQDKRSEYKTISFENLKLENGRSINMFLDIKKRSDQALLYLYFSTLSGIFFTLLVLIIIITWFFVCLFVFLYCVVCVFTSNLLN